MAAGKVTGCNPVDLGCGVQEQCIFCDGGTCNNNACEPCIPRTCADFGNTGCGHHVGCGSNTTLDCCPSGTTCMGGACCAPGQTNVNGICCAAGQVNYQDTCCTPSCAPGLPPGGQVSCGVTIYCQG
jgi:hypothetical protein